VQLLLISYITFCSIASTSSVHLSTSDLAYKMSSDAVTLQRKGNIAIITLNKPQKLNAMTSEDYFRVAVLLHEVATMDDITITILTGTGRFFSAYVVSYSALAATSSTY
jgi:1,4-dihydroxy-2-naphthoyl-CoA synthase